MFATRRNWMIWPALLLPMWMAAQTPQTAQNNPQEAQAYCTYILEQAQAERDLLRTPTASAGMTQPETGLPIQFVGGASLGLSNLRKAGLTIEAARRNCELYKASNAAQLKVQYAVAGLERESLRNRLTLIDQATAQLDALTADTQKMVDAQNATRLMLFTLQNTRIKLDSDRADTQAKIANLYAPPLSDVPLKELVAAKQNSEAAEQQAVDKLNRQSNWDVALQVGVHQQVNPVAEGAQPYGSVSVSYNLGGRAIDRHLDRAATAYSDWKNAQEGDVVRAMEVLHQQLVDVVAVDEARLKSLQQQSAEIDKNLAVVAEPNTSAAVDFKNQLSAAQLLLRVEEGDASFRLARLRDWLAANY